MTKKKRTRTGSAKVTHAHKGTRSIGPKSGHAENEPVHQPDYLLEDHPELGLPSTVRSSESLKQGRGTKK